MNLFVRATFGLVAATAYALLAFTALSYSNIYAPYLSVTPQESVSTAPLFLLIAVTSTVLLITFRKNPAFDEKLIGECCVSVLFSAFLVPQAVGPETKLSIEVGAILTAMILLAGAILMFLLFFNLEKKRGPSKS